MQPWNWLRRWTWRRSILTAVVLIALLVAALGRVSMQEQQVHLPSLSDVPSAQWDRLAQVRIFFGHQSVGGNILEGVKDVLAENRRIRLEILDNEEPGKTCRFGLIHSRVGTNRLPQSKLDALMGRLEKCSPDGFDIVVFKLCYVDVDENSSVEQIFDAYMTALARIRMRHPRTTFVHVTVPLTSMETGAKARIKRIVGKALRGYEDNIVRSRFNQMLRNEYEGRDPIFDLAGIEATSPAGTRACYSYHGKEFHSLLPAYTEDGGHLNARGRRFVAEQFLIFLAGLAKDKEVKGAAARV